MITEKDQLKEFQIKPLRILKKLVTFAKPIIQQVLYDILEDLWLILANVTYSQLFQDPEYKVQIMKAFEENLELV